MLGRRRLNTKGKIAISILLTIMILLLTGLVSNDKMKAAKENDSNIENSLEMLSFSAEPVLAFSDSTLSQSIIDRENEKREVARKKEVAKQNEIDQQENAIYLTFDDGPSSVSDQLLDVLGDFQMKATFFMVGPRIREYPKIVKRMQKQGFGLGLHSITHDVGKIYSSQSSPSEEMIENRKILENITGVRSDVIRLPYGSIPYLTEAMRYLLDQNGFNVWDWNVDSLDWDFKDARYVQHTIQEIERMKQAGETPVVLLHDKHETIKHLPKLLSYIKKQGYQTKILTNDMAPLTFSCKGRCYSIN
ncbi:polysaccharide deacetylase family protein [Oceanobacillus sp. Castelsardo]|uniref:polysaccharide deacetylase family protein n=1 Tax=Oceanobacillus sp. Castelsardo TaxID=1851204 RepID=UPI000838B7F1|nr:polysaccharide deacetylase family protein [Oceanobacillus sp. Castelsardo]